METIQIAEVKKKREFSSLPDNLIKKALQLSRGNIKETRALLRKYFGVFLTNRVLKSKNSEILSFHISSKKRNYLQFYKKIHNETKNVRTIIDLGCGANSFSYPFILKEFGEINYIGVEAINQLVESANKFFSDEHFSKAIVFHRDIFETEKITEIISNSNSPKIIFLLQLIDALEAMERNFSENLLSKIGKAINSEDFILISFSQKSISGKSKFYSKKEWFVALLEKYFSTVSDFEMFDERFLLIRKK